MRIIAFSLIISLLISCKTTESKEEKQYKAQFNTFDALFQAISWTTDDTLNCEKFTFLPNIHKTLFTKNEIPATLFHSIFSDSLLTQNMTDTATHYAIGKIKTKNNLTFYVLGERLFGKNYATHLVVWSNENQQFITTHSLNFFLQEGLFLTERAAWITDINRDSLPDLVLRHHITEFNKNLSQAKEGDHITAEIWKDADFEAVKIKDSVLFKMKFKQ
jgi:hypothetical protein